jgi:hypothetical protein
VHETLNILRKLLFDIAPFAVWVPLLTALLFVKKTPYHILLLKIHLALVALVQAYAYYLWKNSQNNLFLLHIYTVEEFIFLTLFYSHLLKKFISQHWFFAIIILFVVSAVLNIMYLQPLKIHNTNMRGLESLIIIIWTIMYFYYRLSDENEGERHHSSGLLLINSGFLIYFSASLLLFSLGNFMSGTDYREISKSLWSVHAIVSILLYLIIAIGIWKQRNKTTSSYS